MTKAERSRNLRYKKASLLELGYDKIVYTLSEIRETCSEVRWAINDDEALLDALGEEEDVFEFTMAFSSLEAESDQLLELLSNNCRYVSEYFDNCIVGLIGNRFNAVGYDDYEEDYYALTSHEQDLAYTESGKRIMRMTKAEMLSTIGQCVGIVLSFQNIQMKYDYLKATIDIFKDENHSILKVIKDIEHAYTEAEKDEFASWEDSTKKYEKLIDNLPDKFWIE